MQPGQAVLSLELTWFREVDLLFGWSSFRGAVSVPVGLQLLPEKVGQGWVPGGSNTTPEDGQEPFQGPFQPTPFHTASVHTTSRSDGMDMDGGESQPVWDCHVGSRRETAVGVVVVPGGSHGVSGLIH